MKKPLLLFILAIAITHALSAIVATPVNSAPSNTASSVDPYYAFAISSSSLSGYDSVVYEFDSLSTFNTTCHFRSPKFKASSGTHRFTYLAFSKMYWWRTKGFKAGDSSAWSIEWYFTTSAGIVLNQSSSYSITTVCSSTSTLSPGEKILYQIDKTPNFNSPDLISFTLPKICSLSCNRLGTRYPWDTNFIRARSINGINISPWSATIKEYCKLSVVPNTPAALMGDDAVNINFANWGGCYSDSNLKYILYHDTSPNFNSPLSETILSYYPGISNVKLFWNHTNYFRFRYILKDKNVDTTYTKTLSLNGPTGEIAFTSSISSLVDYTAIFPSKIQKFEMEFDTSILFNTGAKFGQIMNAAGMGTFDLSFRPVSNYIRYYMHYRITTDVSTFPWILFKPIRVLTPEITQPYKAADTIVDANLGVSCKNLDSAVSYYFQIDQTPSFNSPTLKQKIYNSVTLPGYWYADTIGFKSTAYYRVMIRGPKKYTDWSPIYVYTPKQKIYNTKLTTINYPYYIESSGPVIGADHIEFELFQDTTKARIAYQKYCFDFSNGLFSANTRAYSSGNYFVRMRYSNSKGASNWSPFKRASFVHPSNTSAMADPVSPADCSFGPGGKVTFRWAKNPNCTGYLFVLKTNPELSIVTTDTFVSIYLKNNTFYHWTVQAVSGSRTISNSTKEFVYNTGPITLSASDMPWSESSIAIYPNPTQSVMHIVCDNTLADVKICDNTGRNVSGYYVDFAAQAVNVSSLASGLYFIKVQTQQGEVKNTTFIKE